MYTFEVKFWDLDSNFLCVEVVAHDWREAQRIVGELDDTSGVEGCVLLSAKITTDEHGIKENTRLILREAERD